MLTAPLSVAAIAVLVRVAVWRGADPWLRLTASAMLVQQCVVIFYAPAGRYQYLTWLITSLVVAAWVEREGLPLLRRRVPAVTGRVARHRLSAALARGLARLPGT